jgi:hypothetical protein
MTNTITQKHSFGNDEKYEHKNKSLSKEKLSFVACPPGGEGAQVREVGIVLHFHRNDGSYR